MFSPLSFFYAIFLQDVAKEGRQLSGIRYVPLSSCFETLYLILLSECHKVFIHNGWVYLFSSVLPYSGETYQVDITLLAHHIGRYHTPLAFMFTRKNEPDRPFYIVRYLSARCSSALVDELQPEEEYEAPSRVAVQELDLEVVDGLPLARCTNLI